MRRSCFKVALFLWLAGGIVSGQVDYATAILRGTVFDPQNRPVFGARLTIVNEATGAAKRVVTSEHGYQIEALQPGTYRLETEADGFSKNLASNLVLTVGELADYDVHLELGSTSITIEVSADIPLTVPEQSQQANIINNVQVENLPNVGRSFTQSIYTLPGVVNSFAPALQSPGVGTGYQSSGFSVGGSTGRNNLVTIDGGENDYGSGALRDNHVPIDSIQEFQVNRGAFAAEFGFTVGTAINMVTKSGSNEVHGSAAAYFRNHSTDAENYFDGLGGLGGKPFEQSGIFSATLGGPIRKNRLFLFTAPEYQKLDAATVQNIAQQQELQPVAGQANSYNASAGTCPNQNTPQQQVTQLCYLTQLAHAGGTLGGLGNILLASPIFGDPLANPILKALVTPNDGVFDGIVSGPSGSGTRAIPGFNTPRGRYFNWVTRADYISSSRDTLSLRFSLMHELDDVVPAPPYSGSEPQTDYTLTASWTRVFGAQRVNLLRVQVVPSNTLKNTAPAPVGSEIDLGGQIRLGSPFSYPYDARFKRFQFDDSFLLVKGSHSLKFGGSWRPDYYNVFEQVWATGQWQFTDGTFSILNIVGGQDPATAAALAAYNLSRGYPAGGPSSTNLTAVQAYLAGTPTIFLQADPNSNSHWAGWSHNAGFYAQDSWKAMPGLNVNYGVRLDYAHDPTPVPSSIRVSPRIGFAWDPRRDHKTVLRAGAGIFVGPNVFMTPFYVNILGTSGKYVNQAALVAGLPSPPFPSIFAAWAEQLNKATTAFPNPPLTTRELAALGLVVGPPGPTAFGNLFFSLAPNFQPEYTIQASFSIARELTPDLTVELSYLMYRSVHIEQVQDVNFIHSPGPVDTFVGPLYVARPGTTAGEPNSSIFQNGAISSIGNGIYNGATASLTRRFRQRLQFQVNYTFSRAIDDTSDWSGLSAPFRPDLLNLDRAVSDFNITHNLVANAVYTTSPASRASGLLRRALAKLTVSPIFYARSGVPFTLLVPGLQNGTITYSANARPWYEGRNNGIGPDFISWDLRISKILYRRERTRIEFIVQGQNILNRKNFAAVNNNFPADPTYPLPGGGTLANGPYHVEGFMPTSIAQVSQPLSFTSTFPARQVSLALRLSF